MKKNLLYVFCLAALFVMAFARQSQSTYYLSTSGADTNSGSVSAPFRTFAKAQAAMSAFDVWVCDRRP